MTESLRERLRARALPSIEYRLPMADPVDALRGLADAESVLRQVRIKDEPADGELETAQAAVTEARAAVDACYAVVILRALPPADYEELRAGHPPTADQKDETVNPDAFRPALLAACAEGDMAESDWAAFLAENASVGEGQALYVTALGVNESARMADPSLGKGWMRNLA